MKQRLEELIKQYKEFNFSYLDCGSKKLMGVSESGECVYSARTDAEIEQQNHQRILFEEIIDELLGLFKEVYNNRAVPDNVLGADVRAAYLLDEDRYLVDFAEEIFAIAKEKNDPSSIISIAQIMELPMLYKNSAKNQIQTVCGEVLPRIAIECDSDTSIYIPHIIRRFCAIGDHNVDKYKALYESGCANVKSNLPIIDPVSYLGDN